MSINRWNLTFAVVSLGLLIINLPMARGETKDMSQEQCNPSQTSNNVQDKTSDQTESDVLNYWTPERMQNAKPLIPTVPETPSTEPQLDVEEPASPSISAPGSEPQSDVEEPASL